MSNDKEYLFHEHQGKAIALRQGGDTSFYGIWYTRWLCPRCSQIVLLIKPDTHQKVAVGSNGIVSVYGFSLNDTIVDKRTGRRAKIEKFDQVMAWRHFDGRKQRVPISGEYDVIYRWIEADPRKPDGRIMETAWSADREKFLKRFQKEE